MALKRQHDLLATYSMASMTDVIFLLLIFFMVTSTFVSPTAFEVNLPKSSEQTDIKKPSSKVYIDSEQKLFASFGETEPQPMSDDQLVAFLKIAQEQDSTQFIALYADESVPYGRIVEVLDMTARHNLKMVLATKPASNADIQQPAEPQPQN